MNDIEKKAREYAEDAFNRAFSDREMPWNAVRDIFEQTFLAGAAYALASQWRDAEKEKPEFNKIVIARIRYKDGDNYRYYPTMASIPSLIRCWIDEGNRPLDDEDEYGRVVAWLPIPEYEPKGE